jgi:hypothetical protein
MTAVSRLEPTPDQAAVACFQGLDAEAALERFDSAFCAFEPDPALLNGTPARTLVEAMKGLVAALTHIDVERVRRRQGWWHVFSGADLEARLELEVAVHGLRRDRLGLAQAAAAAERAARAMRSDLPRLDSTQAAHGALAGATRAWLAEAGSLEGAAGRLQRRLGNLEALHASNRLARAQMALAIEHLEGLLDRYRDIEQLLFPLWQQHALAVAQSSGPAAKGAGAFDQLRSVHHRLSQALANPQEAMP